MPGAFILPLLIGLPLLGAIFVMCTPKTESSLHRGIGLTITTVTFLVSLLVLRYFNSKEPGFQLVFAISDCGRKPSFTYALENGEYTFHADPGAGVGGAHARLRWDLDGNNVPDVDPATGKPLDTPDVKIRAGEVGPYVTLWIEDPVSQKTVAVTRQIREEVQ